MVDTAAVLNGELRVNITGALTGKIGGDGRISFRLRSVDGSEVSLYSDDMYDMSLTPVLVVRTVMDRAQWEDYDAIMEDLGSMEPGSEPIADELKLAVQGAKGTVLTWKSLDTDYLMDDGTIRRPEYGLEDMPVALSVKAGKNGLEVERKYTVTIRRQDAAGEKATVNPELQKVVIDPEALALVDTYWKDSSFTHVTYPAQYLDNVVQVSGKTGTAIQAAIDEADRKGGGVVALEEGIYVVDYPIQMRSNITLAGAGKDRTILQQAEQWKDTKAETMVLCFNQPEEGVQLHDIVLKDLSILGNRNSTEEVAGIFGGGTNEQRHERIMVQGISVKHFVSVGLELKRTDDIIMDQSSFTDNGSGSSLYHNVYFLYNKNILQSELDLSRPVLGKSCKYTSTTNVIAQHMVMRDGVTNAIQADNVGADHILFHDYTIENFGGVGMWFPCEDYTDKYTYKEQPEFAPQYVILNRVRVVNTRKGGIWRIVRNSYILNSYFDNRESDLELLKCGVWIDENTVFDGPTGQADEFDDRSQLKDPILS